MVDHPSPTKTEEPCPSSPAFSSSPASGTSVLKDNCDPHNQLQEDSVVSALFAVAEAKYYLSTQKFENFHNFIHRSAVLKIGQIWEEIREECETERRTADLERTVEEVGRRLEEEKRSHQDELRQINQVGEGTEGIEVIRR